MNRKAIASALLLAGSFVLGCGSSGSSGPSDASVFNFGDGGTGDGGRSGDGGGGCRAESECRQGFESCVPPGYPICGGAKPVDECNLDSDCADAGPNRICLQNNCGGSRCIPKCTGDQDCTSTPAGLLACDTGSGHCVAKTCTATSCPTNFVCSANPSQGCVRKKCATDNDCSGGACVNGACWPGPGTCTPPAA